MKPDKLTKAAELLSRFPLMPDERGNFRCPSHSGNGTHIVSVDGICNCPAVSRSCCHALACFRAVYPILQFRWATDYEWLRAAGEHYRAQIEQMPPRLREECRREYLAALERVRPGVARRAA